MIEFKLSVLEGLPYRIYGRRLIYRQMFLIVQFFSVIFKFINFLYTNLVYNT